MSPADGTGPEKKMPTATSVASGALVGSPVAIIGVAILSSAYPDFVTPIVAAALGSVVATVFATFWHVAIQLAARVGISLNPPSE